jgi:hypothetical protein
VGTDELHEHAPELKRYMDNQPVFIAAEIKDDPVVAHEIDGTAELSLYLGWISPLRFGDGGKRWPAQSCTNLFFGRMFYVDTRCLDVDCDDLPRIVESHISKQS